MSNTITKLKTNLDTDFLKLVAIISMLIDHVGSAFFPQYPIFRWIGRLAFPIFCYCMTVGFLYTHSIKGYLGRLALFAVISQPFYALKADTSAFWENLTNWNIFFTLILSLIILWGITMHNWKGIGIALIALVVLCVWNFDYSYTGVILMLIFYYCRNKPTLGAVLYCVSYLPALWGSPNDPFAFMVAGHAISMSIFALLAAPMIFLKTNTGIKMNKWFFYVFYPAHIAVIVLVKFLLQAV